MRTNRNNFITSLVRLQDYEKQQDLEYSQQVQEDKIRRQAELTTRLVREVSHV